MKLVRDRIPLRHQAGALTRRPQDGDRPKEYTFHKADPGMRPLLLRLKLAEEVGEVLSAPDREALIAELGDVLDVIDALMFLEQIDQSELSQARVVKVNRLGGFLQGWVLE